MHTDNCIYHANAIQKNEGIAVSMSDKVNFGTQCGHKSQQITSFLQPLSSF